MKKSLVITLCISLSLMGCMPDYSSDELEKEKTAKYEEMAPKWFEENEPDMQVDSYNKYDTQMVLTNIVSGTYQDEEGEHTYFLNLDEDILYTDAVLEEFKGYIAEYIADVAMTDKENISVTSNISYGIPCTVFRDQTNNGEVADYSEYQTSINVPALDYYLDENGLRGIAVSALHDKVMPYLSVSINVDSPGDVEEKYKDFALKENFESLDAIYFFCDKSVDETYYLMSSEGDRWTLTKHYKKGDKYTVDVVASQAAYSAK